MCNSITGCLAVAVIGYFLGCFNGAVIVSKYILKNDVRQYGSGNAGLTNFHRTFGGALTFVVILLDVVKAALAIFLAILILGNLPFAKYWGGLFCLLGHMYPCMFGFRGGKGILSGGTIVIMIDWRIALIAWGGFLILTALTRWVSLGSVWAAASVPFSTWFVYHDPILLILGAIMGGLILWKHRSNIGRLLRGTESKLSFHRKTQERRSE